MQMLLSPQRMALLPLVMLAVFLSPRAARAQGDTVAVLEAPTAPVAVLPVALYTAQANVQEATDSTVVVLANNVLQERLQGLLGDQLIARDRVAVVASSPEARDTTGGQPCHVMVACARFVGTTLHVPWVVMAKVSKTSNLIWLFTGQLIHIPTGKIMLDDSTELKGDPATMVRAGARIFAERIARTVRNGGVTTNFPNSP